MKLFRGITSLLFVLFLIPTKSIAQKQKEQRPNIIVILTDDMGYADLDVQGSVDDLLTPNLDELAETGVRMTSGYVTASQCMPSRAGLLAGRYQQRFGLDHNGTIPFPLDEKMIAQRMKDIGYATGMSGKWHLEPNRQHHNWINKNIPAIAGRKKYKDADVPHELKIPYLPNNKGFDFVHEGRFNQYWATHDVKGNPIEPSLIDIPGYRLEIQTESAVTFINKNKDKPFFYYLSYYAPHVPLQATKKYLDRFPGDMPERRRVCLAMIAAMDDGIGRIKETLKKNKIEDNTLIIFLSDNGAALKLFKKDEPLTVRGSAWNGSLNDPYIGEKGMVSEGGIRVPFIMNWPKGLPKGKVYDRPVSSLDIAATSLAIAGEKVPKELDGVNVVPYLNGKANGDPHEALYWRFWKQSAIRVGDWKYLNYDGTEFLFNVHNDEHEHLNLLDQHPEKAKQLKAKLTRWGDGLKNPGISIKGAPSPKRWLTYYFHESLENSPKVKGKPVNKKKKSEKKKSNHPNIVFIMADDLGTRDLACYGSDYYLTPNLDAFASESLKFDKAYAASHVCSPTRASILTGSYPHRIRITDALPWDRLSENPKLVPPNHEKELSENLPNFAKSLKSAGYKTTLIGKWHLGNEHYFFSEEGHKNFGFDEAFHVSNSEKKRDKGVDELTNESLAFLETNREGPFLLYLNHHTPHVPLASTPEDKAVYDGVPKGRHQKNQVYAGMITHLDNSVKLILDKLKELNIDENTIVIFTSDNGGLRKITSNKPFRGNKGDVYEGGVRVPLLVRWPGNTTPGATFDNPVFSTDYFPTFLEMAGMDLDPKAHPDGKSMLSIWKGENKEYESRTFYWHFPHRKNPASSVIQEDWKLVHDIKKDSYELFNLKNDPYERKDISVEYPEKTKILKSLLEQHLNALNAQRMYPNPDWDASKPEGKQRSYGKFERPEGGVFQPVKTPYPTWFKKE